MKILSCHQGQDGAFAYVEDGRLVFSIEAEKGSGPRHAALGVADVFDALSRLPSLPDVLCEGLSTTGAVQVGHKRLLGQMVRTFATTDERAHLLCAFGLSDLPAGTPCYALLWEGRTGAFYELDGALNIRKLGDVMPEPGHRYALLYALADPSFDKATATDARRNDAGKLMALASFSTRSEATAEEEALIRFLLQDTPHLAPQQLQTLQGTPHHNVGLDDAAFRDFVGIFSDRLFDRFLRFARTHLQPGRPLLIAGGCGLNCDWNSKWVASGLFSRVCVPPVVNDSGMAIGAALDAQWQLGGNPKLAWSVYAGLPFVDDVAVDTDRFDVRDADAATVADLLANDRVLAWVQGRYEIGPRALGNRSILAAPFLARTTERLNAIKQREAYRPIAPVCLEADAATWFGCDEPNPYMLYTHRARTDALAAVTHVNRTARIQTVSAQSHAPLFDLLTAFKARTGYGVLCNTSLNFNGRGFINTMSDLVAYTEQHGLDGFFVNGRLYLRKASAR